MIALFQDAAEFLVASHIRRLRETLAFEDAASLPAVSPDDVVVAGKEVLLAIYRQSDRPLPGQILVTVQIARHALGGVLSFHTEKGLVFSPHESPRDATARELAESAA